MCTSTAPAEEHTRVFHSTAGSLIAKHHTSAPKGQPQTEGLQQQTREVTSVKQQACPTSACKRLMPHVPL